MPNIACVPADLDHPPRLTITIINEIIVIVTVDIINPRWRTNHAWLEPILRSSSFPRRTERAIKRLKSFICQQQILDYLTQVVLKVPKQAPSELRGLSPQMLMTILDQGKCEVDLTKKSLVDWRILLDQQLKNHDIESQLMSRHLSITKWTNFHQKDRILFIKLEIFKENFLLLPILFFVTDIVLRNVQEYWFPLVQVSIESMITSPLFWTSIGLDIPIEYADKTPILSLRFWQ